MLAALVDFEDFLIIFLVLRRTAVDGLVNIRIKLFGAFDGSQAGPREDLDMPCTRRYIFNTLTVVSVLLMKQFGTVGSCWLFG